MCWAMLMVYVCMCGLVGGSCGGADGEQGPQLLRFVLRKENVEHSEAIVRYAEAHIICTLPPAPLNATRPRDGSLTHTRPSPHNTPLHTHRLSLAEVLKLQPSAFQFAGTKDKRAITYQYMTVRGVRPSALQAANATLGKHGEPPPLLRAVSGAGALYHRV